MYIDLDTEEKIVILAPWIKESQVFKKVKKWKHYWCSNCQFFIKELAIFKKNFSFLVLDKFRQN
jgi:hypothetical protein